MDELINTLQEWLSEGRIWTLTRVVLLVGVGLLLAKTLRKIVDQMLKRRASTHIALLTQRIVFFTVLILFLVSAMREMGFNLTVLLGAAGILTVAIGFASQTSMSNIISGVFLLSERPFVVSDVIRVGEVVGEVISIDLLSLKIRTFDNLLVRIPNETVIKSEVVNLTHFPIRRVDVQVGVAYKEDLKQVREVLAEVAERNPLCLEDPEPLYMFQGFGDSSLDLKFCVWATRENFLELKNQIHEEIKQAFDEHGIEIPFPHRTLYAGAVTEPLPIEIVAGRISGESPSP
ncbi:MAG TPA: mechanosensitive ion channel family protein [Thermoguttaceae bacterium]|nr:mechanosensitive ion channel family protein [Thermoguttaceae bacterium]